MKWIPLDNWHQKPKSNELYSITDGKRILHDMCLIESDWYYIDDEDPTIINPTHYLKLEFPE